MQYFWRSFSSLVLVALQFSSGSAQSTTAAVSKYDSVSSALFSTAVGQNKAIGMLTELCAIGPRLSGSENSAKAIAWSKKKMEELGFQNVHLEKVMVPHWVRKAESGSYSVVGSKKKHPLHISALGGSIGTPARGVNAEIIEVKSWEQLKAIGPQLKGKIVFFNRPMDRFLLHPGTAYGKAAGQRSTGAVEAAKWGAVAALVRSMTTRYDDVPHTGMMRYEDTIPKIPAAAVSTNDANFLSKLLAEGKRVIVNLRLSCETLPDVPSANVLGEIIGSEKPEEVIVVSGHIDSWDYGHGAHDDGAGCVHAIEALRLIKELGLKPARTIRAVMFINEENGIRGGKAYADTVRGNEKHVAAMESEAGGFAPRGIGVADSAAYLKLLPYAPLFRKINADHVNYGGGGVDIGPMMDKGIPGIGLQVDGQRYFDYHHSANDVLDTVNERELALGAAMMALTAFIIAQEGL